MPKTFIRDGMNVRSPSKLFVRDGNTVRQLTKLWILEGINPRLIYNRIKNYLLSGTAITTATGVTDIQTLNVTGRSNVFIPAEDQEIELRISSNFNSGGFSVSSNSSSSSTNASIDLGNGMFIDVDDSHTYIVSTTGPEEAVILPASNGNSVANPETATYNPTAQFQSVNFQGSTSSELLGAYRVYTTTGGAAGSRIGGGGAHGRQNPPSGWTTGFESGSFANTPQFSATNIPNPVAIGTAIASGQIGDLNVSSNESQCLNLRTASSSSNLGSNGIRESGTSGAQGPAVGIQTARGRSGYGWSSPGGTCGFSPNQGVSFFEGFRVFASTNTTAPAGVRIVLGGPNVTRSVTTVGRRARLRNTNNRPVNITGTFGTTTLAANSSTDYVTADATTISWDITINNVVASWSGTVAGATLAQRNFGTQVNADTALGEISTAILAAVSGSSLDGAITTSGSNRIQRINLGNTTGTTNFMYNMNGALGTFTFAEINPGIIEAGVRSTYTVIAPNGQQLGSFSSSVSDTSESDATTIASNIASIINGMTEQPINYTAVASGSSIVATAASTGVPAGNWSVMHNRNGQTINAGNAVVSTVNTVMGVDDVTATQIRITRVLDGVTTTRNVTLPSAASTDSIGATIAAIGSEIIYNTDTNTITFTGDRDTDSLTLLETGSPNGITLTLQE